VDFVIVNPLEYSTAQMELQPGFQMQHAAESNDSLLMSGRNEPSITPQACRILRRLMMPFSNLIERTVVFLSYTECPIAIANFSFIVQRIIGVAEMLRTMETGLSGAVLCLTGRNRLPVARLEVSLATSKDRPLCKRSSQVFTGSAKVFASSPTRGWIA
jgi:hypothetical protein